MPKEERDLPILRDVARAERLEMHAFSAHRLLRLSVGGELQLALRRREEGERCNAESERHDCEIGQGTSLVL